MKKNKKESKTIAHIRNPEWLIRMDPYTGPPKYNVLECLQAMGDVLMSHK